MFREQVAQGNDGAVHVHVFELKIWAEAADCRMGDVNRARYQAVLRRRRSNLPLREDAQEYGG